MGFLGRRKEEGQDGGPLDMWGKPIRPRLDGWGRPIDDQGAAKGYADAFDGKISEAAGCTRRRAALRRARRRRMPDSPRGLRLGRLR